MKAHTFTNQNQYREFCRAAMKETPYFRTVSKPFELPIVVHVFQDEREYKQLKKQNESKQALSN